MTALPQVSHTGSDPNDCRCDREGQPFCNEDCRRVVGWPLAVALLAAVEQSSAYYTQPVRRRADEFRALLLSRETESERA